MMQNSIGHSQINNTASASMQNASGVKNLKSQMTRAMSGKSNALKTARHIKVTLRGGESAGNTRRPKTNQLNTRAQSLVSKNQIFS